MEQSNPFDRPQGPFFILQNRQGYSLWPAHCAQPAGWQQVFGPAAQAACNEWLAERWQTLTPGNFAAGEEQ
ncbi:MbtH family protein [Kalamiella sp. sgz302252]|uniref:MbtH family protein n=1 Tax=Pantoea sp. sgz302252 TaxID=3341827 RepID=UPI0036D2550A